MGRVLMTMAERKAAEARRHKRASEWSRKNTKVYQVTYTLKSGIPAIMEKMSAETGMQPATYIRQAVAEKLRRDGYVAEIPDDKEEPEEE